MKYDAAPLLAFALLVATAGLAVPASAQFTLTADDFRALFSARPQQIQTFVSDTTEIVAGNALADQAGAGQTWDLRPFTYTLVEAYTTQTLALPSPDVPEASDPIFEAATHATISESDSVRSVHLFQLDDDGLYSVGFETYNPVTSEPYGKTHWSEPVLQLAFPLAYGSSWTYEGTLNYVTGDPVVDDLLSGSQTHEWKVDGYGTLITPVGTFEVIRIHQDITLRNQGVTARTGGYGWYTRDGYSPASMGCPVFPVIGRTCSVQYRVIGGGSGGGGGGGEQNQPPAAAAITSPADGASVVVGGTTTDDAAAPDDAFVVTWDAATDPDGDALTYRWQLSTSDAFATTLVDAASDDDGVATRYTTDVGTLAALLTDAGVATGSDLTLYHRVVASDGTSATPSAAAGITLTRGTLVTTEGEGGVPGAFALHANYPNPFNPSTTFRFDLPRAADVSLVVYDALGRAVATVASGRLPAGTHARAWDASGLPSGVYLYRLRAGDHVEARTLTLTK